MGLSATGKNGGVAAVDEFELVDERADDGAVPVRSRPHRGGRSRPLPWVGAAIGLVLVGAIAAEPVVLLGAEPGIAIGIIDLPLARTPTVAWETSYSYPQVVEVTDELAVLLVGVESSQDVVGVDLVTGGELWRYHAAGATCHQELPVTCVEQAGTVDATIVTVATDDGALTRTPYPGALGAVAVGEDLVVAEPGLADIEEVVLLEPDGTERWRVNVDAADTESVPAWVWLSVDRGQAIIEMSGVTIDLQTGEIAQQMTYTFDEDEWAELGPDGTVTIYNADDSVVLGPSELTAPIDDDAGGAVVLRQTPDAGLLASVRSTDDELWEQPEANCFPQARLQHRFLLSCWGAAGDERLRAINEVTGETVWERPISVWPAAASRDTLLMVDQSEGGLHALDPATGDVRWQLPGEGFFYDTSVDGNGGLLISGESSLIRLVWD